MSKFRLKDHLRGDSHIWLIMILLSLFSIAAVYSSISALAFRKTDGNTEYYLLKHGGILLGCLFLTYIIHRIDFARIFGVFKILLWVTPFLLAYTLLKGTNVGGASRWVSILGISFQTSDLVRLVLITNLAAMLARRQNIEYSTKKLVSMIVWIILLCGLLFFSSFSTSMILGFTCFMVMLIGRVPKKYLMWLSGGLIGVLIMYLGIGIIAKSYGVEVGRFQTVVDRIEAFTGKDFDNDKYIGGEEGSDSKQKDMALTAIAKGGFLGVGPGNSSQKNVLPDAFSDFIYSIIIEEYGLLGGLVLMGLYLWLLFRGLWNIENTDRAFGGLLSIGLTLSIVFQAFAHMFINVGLGPVTGQTLPLISMGGTSMIFTSVAVGIVLGVSNPDNQKTNHSS
jgi:cell division protein FtsW